MVYMDLRHLGWGSFFTEQFAPYTDTGCIPGRVAAEHKTGYVIYTGYGELRATVAGAVRYRASDRSDFPVVGDWVAVKSLAEGDTGVIQAILPRKNSLSRKIPGKETEQQFIAANIDTVFWVSSLNRIFNLRRMERFLIMAYESGAHPAIILNKADLCDDVETRLEEVIAIAPGIPVHVTSAILGTGLDSLIPYITDGKTAVFLGLSGVGKSTIINRLAGENIQKVNEIRPDDDRGRHTTAVRSLIPLPMGGCIIDSPGIRELQLWESRESFHDAFSDIESLALNCRFTDCRHEAEPGCAVKKAIVDGLIDQARFGNYMKMRRESDRLERQKDMRVEIEHRRKTKAFFRQIKRDQKMFFSDK